MIDSLKLSLYYQIVKTEKLFGYFCGFSLLPDKFRYYTVFIYRLGIALLMLFLCRWIFYYYNYTYFGKLEPGEWQQILRGGFKFDIAALFYLNGIFCLLSLLPLPFRDGKTYQKLLRVVFIATNALGLLLNCVDFIYFRFTLKRTQRNIFTEFAHEEHLPALMGRFLLDYWHVLVIFLLLTGLMIWLYCSYKLRPEQKHKNWQFYTESLLALGICILAAVAGIRGDLRHSTRPITISNAGEYVRNSTRIYLVLNTPFTFFRTWSSERLHEKTYFSDAEVEKIYSPLHYPAVAQTDSMVKKNVVVIILESFGKEAIGGYNKDLENGNYKGFTPFLDSLMGASKVYYNSFASGRKSIDALPAVLAGIPNGAEPFVLTPYVSNHLRSLPMLLSDEGYNTSFFHGAPNGSMGFKACMQLLGVNNYYGKDEFNNNAEYDGMWGIWDEPFFQFFGDKLSTFKQPFFSTIFSVSSHHPFEVPAKYKGRFPKGPLPVLECISYTDMALQKFFDKVKKEPWFHNTIFVITADHATISYHKEYQNAWGDVAIPILFYSPGDPAMQGTDSSRVLQQIDIMPSILHKLNYSKPFFSYGKNVFDTSKPNFAISNWEGCRWIEDNYLLYLDGDKPVSLIDYKNDRTFQNNLLQQQPERALQMETHAKAFLQQYNNRLIRDQMTVH